MNEDNLVELTNCEGPSSLLRLLTHVLLPASCLSRLFSRDDTSVFPAMILAGVATKKFVVVVIVVVSDTA